jgi:NAD(P)-dependent dehydrogenase (short-subunit alcohol dehydrogenase family)
MPTALITGASAGLGRATATALAKQGWTLLITARDPQRLDRVATELSGLATVHALAGDVADPGHRDRLLTEIGRLGGLDLLINNASTLGPTPLRPLAQLTDSELANVLGVNLAGPFALIRAAIPALIAAHPGRTGKGAVINISSDAAVEHYPDWGAYGASKAALDHLTLTLAAENPDLDWYAIDPGDMRTDMQQAAFPDEDISDRRDPADVVPALLDLIARRPPAGRYRAGDGTAQPDRSQAAGTA